MNRLRTILTGAILLILSPALSLGQAPQTQVSQAAYVEVMPGHPLFINSAEAELQLGRGGGTIGFMAKANHWQIRYRPGILYWGGSLSYFRGSEDWDAPPAQIEGNNWDGHVRLHLGNSFYQIFHSSININFELYGGGFYSFSQGTYTQTNQGFSRDFTNKEWIWDMGGRIAIQYHIKNGWGIQTSVVSSWKQAGFGLGVPTGLFASEPDGKTALGIGIFRTWGWDRPFKEGELGPINDF